MTIDFHLYMITDRHRAAPFELVDRVREALAAGVRAVQLRDKDLPRASRQAIAKTLLPLIHNHSAKLLINSDIDLAIDLGADGIHLPDRFDIRAARRRIADQPLLLGASVHTLARAQDAADTGADFVVLSPIFSPLSKPYPPVGLALLSQICRSVSIPIFALGGITPENCQQCLAAGAHGVAAVSALMTSPNLSATVQAFRKQLRGFL